MAEQSAYREHKGIVRRHPALVGLMLGVCTTLAVEGLSLCKWFRAFEIKTYDMRLKYCPTVPMSDRIVLVDMDDASIRAIGTFPFPRAVYANVISVLERAGADQIVFDVEFPDPSPPSVDRRTLMELQEADPGQVESAFLLGKIRAAVVDNDAAFAQRLEQAQRVYIPFSVDTTHVYSPEVEAWYGRAKPLLLKDIRTSPQQLADAVGIALRTVRRDVIAVKRRVVREFLDQHSGQEMGPEQAAAALIPGYDTKRDGNTPAARLVQAECGRRQAVRHIQRIAGLDLPGQNYGTLRSYRELNPPVPILAQHVEHTGFVNIEADALDGTLRRVRPAVRFGGKVYLQLAVRATLDALGVPLDRIRVEPRAFCFSLGEEEVSIPLDREGMALVNWAGGAKVGWLDTFSHIPFAKLHEVGERRRVLTARLDLMDEATFRGRVGRLRADPNSTPEQVAALEQEMIEFVRKSVERGRAMLAKVSDPARAARMAKQLAQYEEPLQAVLGLQDDIDGRMAWVRRQVGGKTCIIGSTARSSTDLKPTPVHPHQPGVTLHANTMNMILQRQFLRRCPRWVDLLLIAVWGLTNTIFALRGSAKGNAMETLVLLAANCAISVLLFVWAKAGVALLAPLVAQVLGFAAVTTLRQLTEERTKRLYRTAFEHYLSPEVVEQVATDPDRLRLGGEIRDLTVLFTDIQGFSTVSESMPPHQLVEWLNEYLSEMSQTIIDNGGCVDKYEGDLIMAFFGAPLEMPDHAARACRTMIENSDKLAGLRETWLARGLPPIYARVGMNTDRVLVGNLGSRTRLNYSVIGDGVNLAARLEPANKVYGTYLMISQATHEQAQHAVVARELDTIRVVGKAKPIVVYELIGLQGQVDPDVLEAIGHYGEGLGQYRERRWSDAIESFTKTLACHPNDPPSKTMMGRCEEFTEVPPPEAWDGVFNLTSKE